MTVAQNSTSGKDKESTRRTTLRAPLDLSRRVAITAALRDVSQQDLWFEAMHRYLRHLGNKQQLSVLDQK